MNNRNGFHYQEIRPPRICFHVNAKTERALAFQEKYGQVFYVPEFERGPEPKLTVVNPHGVSIEVQQKANGDIYVDGELLYKGGWKDVNSDA